MNPSHIPGRFRTDLRANHKAGYDPPMTILLPALGVAFMAVCVWLGARIFNRHERWAKRTATALVLLAIYAGAYRVMMKPYLFYCRPGGGFGTATFAKPAYRWRQDGPLASCQEAWRSIFLPAFVIHRSIDPDWYWLSFGTHVPAQNIVSEVMAYAEFDSRTAWPTDDFGRIVLANRDRK